MKPVVFSCMTLDQTKIRVEGEVADELENTYPPIQAGYVCGKVRVWATEPYMENMHLIATYSEFKKLYFRVAADAQIEMTQRDELLWLATFEYDRADIAAYEAIAKRHEYNHLEYKAICRIFQSLQEGKNQWGEPIDSIIMDDTIKPLGENLAVVDIEAGENA